VKDPLEEASEEVAPPTAAIIGVAFVVGLVGLFVLQPGARIPLLIVLGLVGMVMLHEAGHFVTARRAGMKVTEFFVGFGPRVWSFRRGETEYGVKAIPAGGYVRIIGMHNLEKVDADDEDRTFRSKPFRFRFVVVLAGITVNLMLAFGLFFVTILGDGRATGPTTTISGVTEGSPADEAGIRVGDRVLTIAGEPIDEWDNVSEALVGRADEPTTVVLERDRREIVLDTVPAARTEDTTNGCLGIGPTVGTENVGVGTAGREAARTMVVGGRDTAVAIGRLVSPAGVSEYSRNFSGEIERESPCVSGGSDRPVSIIGIVSFGSDAVGDNLWHLVFLLGAINLLLALFNLIPLLPFDGGHAAIALYETVIGKITRRDDYRADFRKMIPVSAVVLIFLLTLAVSAAVLDVRDLAN